jgi:sensor histidine kinase regulating citrate/malate metabolism
MGNKTDSINESVIVISEEGGFRKIGAAACEILGNEKDEPVGQPVKIIFSKNEPPINSSGFSLIIENDFLQRRGKLII